MNPTLHKEVDFLSGPIVGLRTNFEGFGLIFDTYDNDNQRDNPTVFAIKNFQDDGQPPPDFRFNHNSDFVQDMIHESPGRTYKCTVDYRNTMTLSAGASFRVLARYQHKVLHVYVDKGDGQGYQFCLNVNLVLPVKFQNRMHLAMTALTGQLADQHDIQAISTRYLDAKDAEIQDSALRHVDDSGSWAGAYFFWIFLILLTTGTLCVHGWEWRAHADARFVNVWPRRAHQQGDGAAPACTSWSCFCCW